MKNLLEVREYKFENVTIHVELDRQTKQMSFVEYDKGGFNPKEWEFAGRELSYMNGWINILKAMEYVIEDCKKTMESWEDEETDMLIKLLTAVGNE